MSAPVRVAAVSFDHGHQFSYLRAMLRLPEIELVAVSDPDPEQRAVAQRLLRESNAADSVRVHANHTDVFNAEDIDAVGICAANAAHHDLTLAAAEAGKHVLCEKPLAVSLAEATAMVRGCADHGVTLATAYPVRHAAPVWEAKRRLDSGELGAIRAMSLTNVLRAQTAGWFIDPARSGGGAIRDHIVHATDLMRWFSGAEVSQVYCEADTLARDIPVEDTGALIQIFDSGVIGTCDPSWNRPPTWRKWGDVSGRIVCDGGVIEFDVTDHVIRVTSADPAIPYQETSFGSDMNAALLRDFAAAVATGRPSCADGHDGWAGVACTEAGLRLGPQPRFRGRSPLSVGASVPGDSQILLTSGGCVRSALGPCTGAFSVDRRLAYDDGLAADEERAAMADEAAQESTYTVDYNDDYQQLLDRRSVHTHAAHLLPHLRPGLRVLDFGCGPGTISVGLAEAVEPGELHGIDMEATQIDLARAAAQAGGHANATFHVGDVSDLPFDDDSFDVAHCHAVLMHVPDTPAVLAEVKRVLKPGGLIACRESIILSSFLHPGDEETAQAWATFARLLAGNGGHPDMGLELKARLLEAGFVDIRASRLLRLRWQRLGRGVFSRLHQRLVLRAEGHGGHCAVRSGHPAEAR